MRGVAWATLGADLERLVPALKASFGQWRENRAGVVTLLTDSVAVATAHRDWMRGASDTPQKPPPRSPAPGPPATRPTEAEMEGVAEVLARELLAHLVDGLSHGRLAAVLSVGRSAEHLVGLVGPRAAEAAFAAVCRAE